MPDLTHLGARIAVPEGTPESAEAVRARALHEYWAGEYVRQVAGGEPGPAIACLSKIRQEEGVDPWRLLEQAVPMALARQPRKAR